MRSFSVFAEYLSGTRADGNSLVTTIVPCRQDKALQVLTAWEDLFLCQPVAAATDTAGFRTAAALTSPACRTATVSARSGTLPNRR